MTDDVLAVKYSPDNRLLAVALLDSTVKVFFQDTLKFFLSLYGHKVRLFPLVSYNLNCRMLTPTAPGPVPRHLPRLPPHRHRLLRQERQDLGPRLWRLPPLHLCTRRQRHAGRVGTAGPDGHARSEGGEAESMFLDGGEGQGRQVLGRGQGVPHRAQVTHNADWLV